MNAIKNLNDFPETLIRIASDAKVGATTAATTTATGFSTWVEWIPSDIGKVATIIGIILSSVLIFVNLKKHFREEALARLDMQLKLEEVRRINEAIRRGRATGGIDPGASEPD